LADDLITTAILPIEEWRDPFKGELERLLHRSYHSPLARPWLTDSEARTEEPFTLVLNYGLVHGKIDYIGRAKDGCWQLVDYKTGPIADRNEAAHRYRLQMEIYALCLQNLYPAQDSYIANLYFTDLDQIHRFCFAPAELNATRARLDDLIVELSQTSPHP